MRKKKAHVLILFLATLLLACCSRDTGLEGGLGKVFPKQSVAGARVDPGFGNLPLAFEENRGQVDRRARFLARGQGWTLFLGRGGPTFVLSEKSPHVEESGAVGTGVVKRQKRVLRMELAGADHGAEITGRQPLPGRSHYLVGRDPRGWIIDVPSYGRVVYRDVYPGVDFEVYGKRDTLEYDFIVHPGFSPAPISLSFPGAQGASVDGNGNLVISTDAGEVIHHAPRVSQRLSGGKVEAPGRFVKRGDGTFGFALSSYDTGKSLIIDPEVSFGTYLGGTAPDEALGIAVDASGNVYIAGRTFSDDFPTAAGALDEECGSDSFCDDSGLISDIFVAKIDSTGTGLIYSTYIGGSGNDRAAGIAIDASGNAYVAGGTESADFPLLDPFRLNLDGPSDVFLLVLGPTGSQIRYSTYYGGSGDDEALAVAVSSSGDAFVAGFTASTDFPTDNPLQGSFGGGITDGFVARFDIDTFLGTGLPTYSTYIGGSEDDSADGIAVDASGDIYVTGKTNSDDFPTKNPITDVGGESRSGGDDAFVTKIAPSFVGVAAIAYSTYLGGAGSDGGFGIGVDSSGNAYVTGKTFSSDFPVKSAFQTARGGSFDAFVSKVGQAGSTLLYSTYLGGSGSDEGSAISVTSSGLAYVTGRTASTDFPVVEPIQANSAGVDDLFLAKFRSTGSSVAYSTYLGGSNADWGRGVAYQGSDNVFVAGHTNSDDFPVLDGFDEEQNGNSDAFVVKIDEKEGVQRFDVVSGCGVSGQGGIDGDGFIPAYGLMLFAALFWAAGRRRKR